MTEAYFPSEEKELTPELKIFGALHTLYNDGLVEVQTNPPLGGDEAREVVLKTPDFEPLSTTLLGNDVFQPSRLSKNSGFYTAWFDLVSHQGKPHLPETLLDEHDPDLDMPLLVAGAETRPFLMNVNDLFTDTGDISPIPEYLRQLHAKGLAPRYLDEAEATEVLRLLSGTEVSYDRTRILAETAHIID